MASLSLENATVAVNKPMDNGPEMTSNKTGDSRLVSIKIIFRIFFFMLKTGEGGLFQNDEN